MLGLPEPLLSVSARAVKDLDGEDAVLCLWNVFSKCKDSLAEGERLEYISWRCWHREMSAHHSPSPVSSSATTPSSEKDAQLLPSPSPSPVSLLSDESSPKGVHSLFLLPSPLLPSIHSVPSTDTLCSARSPHPLKVGRMIFDHILPEKISLSHPQKRPIIDTKVDISSPSPAPSATVPAVLLPSTPPNVTYPKVVIVNPTPHPTPPATPLVTFQHGTVMQGSTHLQAPPSRANHLTPPARSLAPMVTKLGEASRDPSAPNPTIAPPTLLRASPKPISEEGGKVPGSVSHPKFFFKESPEHGDSSPDRDISVRKGIGGCDASSHGDSSAGKSIGSDKAASSLNSAKMSSVSSKTNVSQAKKTSVGAVATAAPARRKAGHSVAARPPRPAMNRMNSRFGQKKSKSSTNVAAIAPLAGPSNLAMMRTTSTRSEARAVRKEDTVVSPKRVSAPPTPVIDAPAPARVPAPTPAPVAAVVNPPAVRPPITRRATERLPSNGKVTQTQRRGIVVDDSSDFETTDSDDESEWASEDVSPGDARARKQRAKKQQEAEKAKREEEEKAQREKDMFAKLPRRSYTNLPPKVSAASGLTSSGPGPRTGSVGLLSQLLNPDPTIFPPNHPYRTSFSTQDMTQFSRGGGSGLAMSRLSTVQPVTTQVTPTHAPAEKPDLKPSSGKYRPKGKPEGAEFDDSEDEDENNRLELSTSLAQQKLAALAGPGRRQRHQPKVNHDQLPAAGPRPGLTSVTSAPIPLSHPYNLPAPAAPSTPRTTRRQMLSTELSESLRRNLLWERQISRVGGGGKRRGGMLGGGTLRPLTTMENAPAPPNSEADSNENPRAPLETNRGGGARSGEDDSPGSKEERKRKALARNRSWADDYHYAGW